MPELICQCGAAVPVEIWQAGTVRSCPQCGAGIDVPDSMTLKRLQGDEHPFWSDRQRLEHAVETGEEPFHGECHVCGVEQAQMEVPIEVSLMMQRDIEDERPPVVVTPLFVHFSVARSTEYWETIRFPLLLCHGCYSSFIRSMRWPNVTRALLFGLAGGLLLAAMNFVSELAVLWVFLFVLLLVYFVICVRRPQSRELLPWVTSIPFVENILVQEEEFVIKKLPARPFEHSPR